MTTEAPPCAHHDLIEPPHGATSKARCKRCGREREYDNFRWADYNNEPLNRTPIQFQQERIWDE
jgi:hypothetical protein